MAPNKNPVTAQAPHTGPLPVTTRPFAERYGMRPQPGHKRQASNPLTIYGGSEAQPGKVLDKAERQRRAESQINAIEEVKTEEQIRVEETGFRHLSEKISNWIQPCLKNVSHALAPEAAANPVQRARIGTGPHNVRNLIVVLIAFLAVFFSFSMVLNHLFAITRVSAQCNASTVIFPVTYTYTTLIFVSPTACTFAPTDSAVGPASTMPTITRTATSTHFSTLTVTETTTHAPDTSTTPYLFTGSTSWIDGHSPSSGVSIVVATTTIYTSQPPNTHVPPPPDTSRSTSYSTTTMRSTVTKTKTVLENTATVSPPVYTSTSSVVVTHLTSTTHITRTSTISIATTIIKSSYTSVGTQGWNGTSSAGDETASGSVTAATTQGTPTTLTGTYYVASSGTAGITTYSTTTKLITTTIFGSLPSDTTIFVGTTASLNSSQASIAPYATSNGTAVGAAGNSDALPSPTVPSGASGFTTNPPSSLPTMPGTGYGYGWPGSPSSVVSSNTSSGTDVGAVGLSSDMTSEGSTTPFVLPTSSPNISGGSTVSWNTSTSPGVDATAPVPPTINLSGTANSPAAIVKETTMTTAPAQSTLPTNAPYSYGYGAPSLSAGNAGVGDSSVGAVTIATTITPLSSVIPSTQLLSSFGTGLANGAGSPLTSTVITTSSSTVATNSPSASPPPAVCGEHGDFVLTFDDLPTFSGSNQTDITQAPPVWNPYHHLTFSDGYVYAPLPKEPYLPHSGDKLAVFLGNGTGKTLTPSAMSPGSQGGEPGEISDGPYSSNSAFWFNARSAFVGCDNLGPSDCLLNATGYTWDANAKDEVPTYNQVFNVPACPTSENCQLNAINFPPSFANLTGLQFQAFVGGQQVMFFMDDLALTWSNNTCTAGLERQGGGGAGPGHSGGGPGRSGAPTPPSRMRMRSVRRSIRR